MKEFKIKIPALDTPPILYSYEIITPIFKGHEEEKNQIGECSILIENGKHYGEMKIFEVIDLNWKFLMVFKPVEDLRFNIIAVSLRAPNENNKHLPSIKDYKI